MNQIEYCEIKTLLLEQREYLEIIKFLIPENFEISYVANKTKLSRQAIRQRLINNYEPEVDFWKKGAKIYMSQKVALQIINMRSNKCMKN